ncbi:hypothetical protein [Blastococcus sp. Marseille-P5729]|uniref:hypothetical protein n=1 Tax=Blastococcus sp. Marseille-P5729 TaxID=2086582 RepID=UPI00131B0528|nr:hypothetical protein [Blastococcus sp. Marseille-P5729]
MASPAEWELVERLAPLTGAEPVPEAKRAAFRTSHDKFADAGLTAVRSQTVAADRVHELPVSIEAVAGDVRRSADGEFFIVQAEVRQVLVREDLVVPGTDHVDLTRWQPLLYNFRHYFGQARDLGKTFRAEY